MIIVSSCLLGVCARYDGGHNACALLLRYAGRGQFLPLCPEQLGGLPTPRRPAEITGGDGAAVLTGRARVVSRDGDDLTAAFIRGADQLLAIAGTFPVTAAILKARSPSCGVGRIYDGSFSRTQTAGSGVTAAALAERGLPLYTEETIDEKALLTLLGR
jgi:uncharacterized protein YbbK (DUF523 family)